MQTIFIPLSVYYLQKSAYDKMIISVQNILLTTEFTEGLLKQ